MEDRYTAQAFVDAIGERLPNHSTAIHHLFRDDCDRDADSLALGLGLEWLRKQNEQVREHAVIMLLKHVSPHTSLRILGAGIDGIFLGLTVWMFEVPRPGQIIAKAIIDAAKGETNG